MKAAIYLGQEHVAVQELPDPVCGDNDVIIRNIYSSICGTEVAVYTKGPNTGHKVTVGGEFGHETVSRVVEVGKNVTDFQVGDRVYPYPLYVKNDTRRAGTIGGFSECILVPEAKCDHSLYAVPEEIPDRLACLIEPFTVGCRAARRGQPQKGENAVVFGCGTIGLAAALTGMAPAVDCWIDAAGAESILDLFMQSGKIISRFVAVAVNNKPRQLDLLHMTYAQKSIIGSGGYFPEDVRDVMTIMASGRWDLESVITQEFPLEQICEAIQTAADPSRAFNVTIRF